MGQECQAPLLPDSLPHAVLLRYGGVPLTVYCRQHDGQRMVLSSVKGCLQPRPALAVYQSDGHRRQKGTRVSLSAFHHRTHNPYMASTVYTPFSYNYTPVATLENVTIPSADRIYSIDQQGIVTISDATGAQPAVRLDQDASGNKLYNTRRFYQTNTRYVNASPLDRYGLEWIIDFKQIKALNTTVRFDGNYYYYKSADETLFASMNNSNTKMTGTGEPYQYIGWYRGTNSAGAAITSLYSYRKALSELDGAVRGIALESQADYMGTPFNSDTENKFIAIYPEYYSTWDNPSERIPFAEKFLWAKDNDATLYNDLCNLVVKSNTPYTMDANRISAYYSANFSVTKEIGDHVSLSFYANNFFNNMKTVHSSQTDLETSLFSSGYIPSYYYGLSLRLKL